LPQLQHLSFINNKPIYIKAEACENVYEMMI
jgi:hypothetical protein